ncbi:MAG: HD domain-containing protein [Candidatus Latescibacteria bacterium]|jgi:HD-GYP domain-containing protein (c-di-GMP phosphodiesterase class II)|nr:HD domain-containing protein [Candidatus Latescibacterota bacterium]
MENNPYFLIDVKTIRFGALQAFDVFFLNGEGEKVIYCANGEVVNEEVLEKIQEHNIEKLYILEKDKKKYNLYIEKFLGKIISDPQVNAPVKAKTVYDSMTNVAALLFDNPTTEIIIRYKNVINNIVEYIFENDSALKNLINLSEVDITTFNKFTTCNHCINVGLISTGLAKELLKDQNNYDFIEMAKGFFLHDIGNCIIPLEILNKNGQLSHEEWRMIRRHPKEGVKILTQFNELTDVMKLIVLQHHERNNGKGYPQRLRGDQIHIYAKICSIADVFDGLTSFRPHRKKYTTFEALTIMRNEIFKDLGPDFFAKFVKVFSS